MRSIRKRRPTTSTLAVPSITLELPTLPSATPIGSEIIVQALGGDLHIGDSIATNADGDFVVTWGEGSEIKARMYNADGTPAGDAFQVNTTTANDQQNPSVAMNAAGEFVIVWDSAADDGLRFDGSLTVRRERRCPGLHEIRVNADEDARRQYAKVGIDSEGGFVVAWRNFDAGFSFSSVYARRFDAAGVAVGDEFIANSDVGFQMSPDVAMTPDGSFVLTWLDPTTIYARQFDSSGNALGERIEVRVPDRYADSPECCG